MATFGDTLFPARLTKIDELTRGDHSFLEAGDECLFFGDYSARKGFAHSETNQLILNFKKPIRYRGTSSWQYKAQAIADAGKAFSANLGSALSVITLVPVPPSKLKADADYDDRILAMLTTMNSVAGSFMDIREMIRQTRSMIASHESTIRLPPSEWEKVYVIEEALSQPEPSWIGIIDDLLVTGCRFRAMSNILKQRFPAARITGLFIARRVPDAIDVSEMQGC